MNTDIPYKHLFYLVITELERPQNLEYYMMYSITEIRKELTLRSKIDNGNEEENKNGSNAAPFQYV